MGTRFNFTLSIIACAFATGATAQVKCTMPNGKTITLLSTPRCPADATKWATLQDEDITPASAPSRTHKPHKSESKGATYIVQPRQEPAPTNPMDTALQICSALKKTTSAWCSVTAANGRYQAFSTIKIWDNITTSAQANSICRDIASSAHTFSGGSMRSAYWQVEIYSKHGATSPLSKCNV